MAKPKLLIVDDEQEVLNALKRLLHREYEVFLFTDPIKALDFYRDNSIPLVISDMRMPIMDGATFLSKISEINVNSKRFLLTGYADINATVNAVNEGKISHYFAKPWNNDELLSELKIAHELCVNETKTKLLLKQKIANNSKLSLINSSLELQVNKSETKLKLLSSKEAKNFSRLKKTFSTFIEIYAETIALHTQDKTQHNFRVAEHAEYIAEQLNCDKLTVFQIYIAGLIYETGKLAIPQSLLTTSADLLNHNELTSLNSYYDKGAELLQKVDELLFVAEIIKHIPEQYNGLGLPEHLSKNDIPLGSRILAIISMFDNLVIGRLTQTPISVAEAKHRIEKLSASIFDPQIVQCYINFLNDMPLTKKRKIQYPVNVAQLKIGDKLNQAIKNDNNNVLLTAGTIIEQQHIDKLIELELENEEFFTLFINKIDQQS